jgi:hypothetical protein
MPQKNTNSNGKKISFWQTLRSCFQTTQPTTKVFPWMQSGLVLLGFAIGVLVTTGVDILSRLDFSNDSSTVKISESDKCMDKGGRYDTKTRTCLLATNDDGNQCSSNDDCEGWCLTDEDATIGEQQSGYCSENFRPTGCFKFIDNGKVNEICIP